LTHSISRRQLLGGGLSAAVSAVLLACGGGATPSPSASRSAVPSPASAGPTIAPTSSQSPLPTPSPSPSLEARIARLLVVGFRGLTIEDVGPVADSIANAGLGGLILFSRDQLTGGPRNVESPEQLERLVADLRALAPDRTLLIAIDQEGGRVARLTPETGFPAFAGQDEIAADGDDAIGAWAESIATTLSSVSINVNLAPVVDLNVNPDNPAIGALGRSFSADPDVVAHDAAIEIDAHRDAGVRTALKHFPGLGSASANTDFGVADVTDTWSPSELEPYRALIAEGTVDAIMVGNLVNGQIDPDAPASLSEATVSGLLRDQLGWDGVVITDDLQAGAITESFGADEAIQLALAAGNDLLLLANQQTYDPVIASHVIQLVAGLVRDGTIRESRIDEAYARVVAFAGDGPTGQARARASSIDSGVTSPLP
jgi:beta-N-acetylhexosaminidase